MKTCDCLVIKMILKINGEARTDLTWIVLKCLTNIKSKYPYLASYKIKIRTLISINITSESLYTYTYRHELLRRKGYLYNSFSSSLTEKKLSRQEYIKKLRWNYRESIQLFKSAFLENHFCCNCHFHDVFIIYFWNNNMDFIV